MNPHLAQERAGGKDLSSEGLQAPRNYEEQNRVSERDGRESDGQRLRPVGKRRGRQRT